MTPTTSAPELMFRPSRDRRGEVGDRDAEVAGLAQYAVITDVAGNPASEGELRAR